MMVITGFSLKPKFCINCKYYIPDDKNKLEYGKCSLFKYNIDKNDEKYLVTGIQIPIITEYSFCTLARNYDSMCGKEAKKYKRKYRKKTL